MAQPNKISRSNLIKPKISDEQLARVNALQARLDSYAAAGPVNPDKLRADLIYKNAMARLSNAPPAVSAPARTPRVKPASEYDPSATLFAPKGAGIPVVTRADGIETQMEGGELAQYYDYLADLDDYRSQTVDANGLRPDQPGYTPGSVASQPMPTALTPPPSVAEGIRSAAQVAPTTPTAPTAPGAVQETQVTIPQGEAGRATPVPLTNPKGSGLTSEQFASLSQDAQRLLQPSTIDPSVTAPAPQGTPTIRKTPADGLVPMWTPTGTVYADPETAMQANAAEGQARLQDKEAMVKFQQSPEGRAFTNRQLQSAIRGGEYLQHSREREARAAQQAAGFGKAVSDRERRGTGEMSMADAVDLAGGDRDLARTMIVRQRQGLDPATGKQMKPTQDSTPERERRVQSLMDTMGISQAQALGIVEGVTRVIQDPVTGEAVAYNQVTGTSEPIDMQPAGQETGTQLETPRRASESLYDLSQKSTGIGPSIQAGLQRIAGQVRVKVGNAPEIINARQTVQTAQQQLIRALSVNPRFPVSEQERIRKEINIEPKTWNDPITLDAKMRAVDSALRDRMQDEIEAANNRQLPRDTRRAARQSANDIANFLDLLDVPEEGLQLDQIGLSEEDQALVDKYIKK